MRNIEETGSPHLSRRAPPIGGAALGAALDGAAAARRARMSP
jgi:hypothetical protein